MLNSLRSRLMLSYVALIGLVLLLVAAALFLLSVAPGTARLRVLPALQQLRTISIGVERQMAALAQGGTNIAAVQRSLVEAAQDHDIRILLVDPARRVFTFDSNGDDGWTGEPLGDVERFPQLLPELNPNLPIGRVRGPDGNNWIVWSQRLALPELGRSLIILALPEATSVSLFRTAFVPPLWRAGIIALAVSLIFALVISRSVAGPLQRIVEAAEAISAGTYDEPLSPKGPDEVQRLARSFNRMAARVSATQEAQRDFLINVSHDLKTPLTSIQGWSQALSDGTAADPERQQTAAQIIRDESDRMSRMVDELIALARLDSGQLAFEPRWVEPGALLADIRRNLLPQAEERRVALTLVQEPAPAIWADPDLLMQALTNIVDNALRYTPESGRVELHVFGKDRETVAITIRDTGPGIPAAEQSRIFERFYQVDKSRTRRESQTRHGAGLGLAIARELIEAHGGAISVASDISEGASFQVFLPVAGPPPDA